MHKGGKEEAQMVAMVVGEGGERSGKEEEEAAESGNMTCLNSWRRKKR